jgi:hypothetical protein
MELKKGRPEEINFVKKQVSQPKGTRSNSIREGNESHHDGITNLSPFPPRLKPIHYE